MTNQLFNFGANVFSDDVIKKMIKPQFFNELMQVKNEGQELSRALANEIAEAMKNWALEKGATHFTHWFFPLTGSTAEKHDAFLSLDKTGKIIYDFSGKQLIKGEADASSLPSGGTRVTFEARGYTVWDCTSPAFIKKSPSGMTVLCIPTAFCSYTGQALDKKTPLLRAMEALNKETLRVLRLLGNTTSKKVIFNLGPEQEYFLIDKKDYLKRIDLKFSGRTLFGAPPPKGQEKGDQYYAAIKERVLGFMNELNNELWKLGVTAKTQHNEVAPCQHELAIIYDTANIATDHNQLIMETMRTIAYHHGLACLLHEKPFEGVNGSGKHCNWSICTDDGIQVLDPGAEPAANNQFLLFFAAVIAAVDEYADIIRMSAGHPGNDYRLGSNEAPPAIISIYVGEMLDEILKQIENSNSAANKKKEILKVGVSSLPLFSKDFSDRNRTSPFAFTGKKFEFRMIGSSATTATPSMVICTAVAEILSRIADELETAENKEIQITKIIQKLLKEHKKVIFNGNNYSKEWIEEAKLRGLSNLDNCVDSYATLTLDKNIRVFEKHNVLSKTELVSRQEIYYENYEKTINIEAKTMHQMAINQIMPAAIKYVSKLASGILDLEKVGSAALVQKEILSDINKRLSAFYAAANELEKIIERATAQKTWHDKAVYFRDKVILAMKKLRAEGDALEILIPSEDWPFPTYTDILFYD